MIEVLQEILTSAKGLPPDDLERHFDNIYYLGNAFSVPANTYKLEIAKMIAVKWGAQIIELVNPVWDRQRESIKCTFRILGGGGVASRVPWGWRDSYGKMGSCGRVGDKSMFKMYRKSWGREGG